MWLSLASVGICGVAPPFLKPLSRRGCVVQLDFLRFPSESLVETVWIGIGWISVTVEPVEVGLFVGNAPAAFRRRMMKTRSGGGSCIPHGQNGVLAIHSLIACHGGSIDSMVRFARPARRAHPSGSGFVSVLNAYKPPAFFDIEERRAAGAGA